MPTKKSDTSKEEVVITDEPVKKEVAQTPEPETEVAEKSTAKAGKRSAKAIKETEEKQAKEERKATKESEGSSEEKPKRVITPSRPRIERAGKKLREVTKLIDKSKDYALSDAIDLAIKTTTTKFDASVELHINLGVDPKHADQNIRGTIVLPAGTGKTVRVAVYAEAEDVAKAKKAGADVAGSDEFLQQLDKEKIDFDVLIATPQLMAKLSKYAKLLGPKGLMPNPKSGTVAADVAKAVTEAKAGKVEYRVDSNGIVHVAVGKVGFGADKLAQNIGALFSSIKAAKPSSIKGNYVKTIYLTTTMGPSIRISQSDM